MKACVRWLDHMSFVGESGSGHSVVMDGSPEHGGRNLASRPMEMILMGLGGCSAFDVMMMLQKSKQDVRDCVVYIDAERADAIPAVFTRIHLKFVITGKGLQESKVSRAVTLSAEKYCSVSKMLESTVAITHAYEVQDSEVEKGP